MVWCVLAQVFAILVDLLAMGRRSADEKDLEIVLLRHELRLLQRRQPAPARLARWEQLPLAVLAAKLVGAVAGGKARLHRSMLVIRPETVLRWHRDLVRRKWTCTRRRAGGRPPLGADLAALILRFAEENPRWGYSRIHGELRKLGYTLSRSTVRDVLKRHRVPPAPERRRCGESWRRFLAQHREQLLACDFFTVETLCLKTVFVLFFHRARHPAGASGRVHHAARCRLGDAVGPPAELAAAGRRDHGPLSSMTGTVRSPPASTRSSAARASRSC